VVVDDFAVSTIGDNSALILQLQIVLTIVLCETPLLGDENLLSARELELGTTEGLLDVSRAGVFAAHGKEDLSNVHTSAGSGWLTESSSHSSLKSVSTFV